MDNRRNETKGKQRLEKNLILLLCLFITVVIIGVLLFGYRPNKNAVGAIGTVSMDVISMFVLILLVVNLTFERVSISKTTKLFLGLLLGTTVGLFFDFLTWTSDGLLIYGGWTYIFTVSSLCTASIVAAFFVFYLGNYMGDMYNLKSAPLYGKLCMFWNLGAFVITVLLVITNKAFVFVDGHYEPGPLYDIVTVLPVLSVVFMVGLVIKHVRTIGIHDVVAVVGYIFIMILGVLIESVYVIGTTYVSISIANVFIFVMLQNKLLDSVKKQGEILSEEIESQYAILESMVGIYSYVDYVDLEAKTTKRFDTKEDISEQLELTLNPHTMMNKKFYEEIEDEQKEKFWAYTDLSTLSERMTGEKIISSDFCHKKEGWIRVQYIRIGESIDASIKKVIYAVRNIDEEKKNVEKWKQKSTTDELTGLYNRHAYEDDISIIKKNGIKENFVYISIDVNGLKVVNDSRGHEAGDELIEGASDCIRQCMGAYGKLYRTGGDEFVALIYADDSQLAAIKIDLEEVTKKWRGTRNGDLTFSCGYVTYKENKNMSVHQMATLADRRMYEDKRKYYQKKGLDRRGKRDAHVALFSLFSIILKINITDDTYKIITMDSDEQIQENGTEKKFSEWVADFGMSGLIHEEDMADYLLKTNIEYLNNYFKNNKSSLRVFYRKKCNDIFEKVMMEFIPASDNDNDVQQVFLYVRDIDN